LSTYDDENPNEQGQNHRLNVFLPGIYCSPRHRTYFELSFLALNGILFLGRLASIKRRSPRGVMIAMPCRRVIENNHSTELEWTEQHIRAAVEHVCMSVWPSRIESRAYAGASTLKVRCAPFCVRVVFSRGQDLNTIRGGLTWTRGLHSQAYGST